MRLRNVSLVVSVVGLAGAGCFVLERAATLSPGTVRGTATIAGAGIDDVKVALANSLLLQPTNTTGDFLFEQLPAGTHALRLLHDDDNDGTAERGAVASFAITQTAAGLSGVDLGSVELRGTVGVSGTVTDLDGGGLDGTQVVVTRFEVDHTAEVLLSVVDDDGDGVIPFTLEQVVPGTIEVFAFAANGRASEAVSVVVGSTPVDGVVLGVAAAPAASVTAQLTPAAPSARFVVVAPGAPIDAAPFASAAVGQFVEFAAGVYDVWFLDDDNTPLTQLVRQVARPLSGGISWGPALQTRLSGEGEGEGEGEGFSVNNYKPLLIHPDGSPSEEVIVTATNADGTPAVLSVEPTTLPIAVDFDPATGVLSARFDSSRGVAAETVLLAHEEIQLRTDGGRSYALPLAYIAHAAYTGAVANDRTRPGSWLSSRFPESNDDSVVILGDLDAAGDLNFGAIDIVVTEGGGGGSIVLNNGRLTVGRVLNSAGEALILGPGNVTVDGELRGRIQDASVTIDGITTLTSLNVVGSGEITVSEGARVQLDGNSGQVYLQVPVTLNTGAVFAIDNGFPHFAADLTAVDGSFEVGVNGGVAFGFFGEEHSFTVNVGNSDLRTASFAGINDSTIDIVGTLTASAVFKAAEAVTLNVDDNIFAGAIQVAPGVTLNSNVTINGNADTTSFGVVGRQLSVLGQLQVATGELLRATNLEVDGGALLCAGSCQIEATTLRLDGAGTVLFGAGVDISVGIAEFVDGFIDLAGGGVLRLNGSGTILQTDNVSFTSIPPREHRIVVNSVELETAFTLADDLEIDNLAVSANHILNITGGTLSGVSIDLAENTSINGSVAFTEPCTGAGAASCPP